jgi:hypothetical protein
MQCNFPGCCREVEDWNQKTRGRKSSLCFSHRNYPDGHSDRNKNSKKRSDDGYKQLFYFYPEYKQNLVEDNGNYFIEIANRRVPLHVFDFAHKAERKNFNLSIEMGKFRMGANNWDKIISELEFGCFLLPEVHRCLDRGGNIDDLPIQEEWISFQKEIIRKYITKE